MYAMQNKLLALFCYLLKIFNGGGLGSILLLCMATIDLVEMMREN
jgi:hypothetical protein